MTASLKILLPVWGTQYIEQFLGLPLAALLSKGNLPDAGKRAEIEVVFLTTEKDIPTFASHPTWQKLREICATRFVDITDLLLPNPGFYAYMLTHVYGRGMIAFGDEMTKLFFLYLNADYVAADGSLSFLVRRLETGASFISGISMRASKERVEASLKSIVSRSGQLGVSPRRLVHLALEHMHPTARASIVNQSLAQISILNRLYWRVSATTVVGRFFLPLILCLRPERPLRAADITSFIDYGFLPTLCPSGHWDVITDSDDFFVLELQEEETERWAISLGKRTQRGLARELGRWTTREHRLFAQQYALIIHSEDVPPHSQEVVTRSEVFVNDLIGRMGRAKPDVHHPYWQSLLGQLDLLPRFSSVKASYALLRRLAGWILGTPPRVRIWHPEHLLWRSLVSTVKEAQQGGVHETVLVVKQSSEEKWLRAGLGEHLAGSVTFEMAGVNQTVPSEGIGPESRVGIIISRDGISLVSRARDWLLARRRGQRLVLFCWTSGPESELMELLNSEWWTSHLTRDRGSEEVLDIHVERIGNELVGEQMEMWRFFKEAPMSWGRLLLRSPFLLLLLTFSTFNNVRERIFWRTAIRGGLMRVEINYKNTSAQV